MLDICANPRLLASRYSGIIGSPSLAVADMDIYPGYTGAYYVNGTVSIMETDNGITIEGTVAGLPPSSKAGFHVHEGVSCDDTSGPGGHYFDGLDFDPWCSDTDGTCATIYMVRKRARSLLRSHLHRFAHDGMFSAQSDHSTIPTIEPYRPTRAVSRRSQ